VHDPLVTPTGSWRGCRVSLRAFRALARIYKAGSNQLTGRAVNPVLESRALGRELSGNGWGSCHVARQKRRWSSCCCFWEVF
jgi:hypothetical protein